MFCLFEGCVVNSKWVQPVISLGFKRITIKTIKEKLNKSEKNLQLYFHGHILNESHNGLIDDVEISFKDKIEPSDRITLLTLHL